MLHRDARNVRLSARNGFGVSSDVGWMFLLPWLILLLTLGVAALAFLWSRKWWTLTARMHYSLVAVACLGFVLLASRSGLV